MVVVPSDACSSARNRAEGPEEEGAEEVGKGASHGERAGASSGCRTHLYARVKDEVAVVKEHKVDHNKHGEQNGHRQLHRAGRGKRRR